MTALQVKNLKHSGKKGNDTVSVGGADGLKLQITSSGAKSWLIRYASPTHMNEKGKSKIREMGLGPYPSIGLKDAREKALEVRKLVIEKIDPIDQAKEDNNKRQSQGFTVKQAVDDYYLQLIVPSPNADRTKQQWINAMNAYVVPGLGSTLVKDIDTDAVVTLLEPIWLTKPRMASDVRNYFEHLLDWATHKKIRTGDNPARLKGNLEFRLPKQDGEQQHHPALQLPDTSSWFAELRTRRGNGSRALEFLAMTAVRSENVRRMTWDEYDEETRIWTIPKEKMKMKRNRREHRVPLSNEAIELLKQQPRDNKKGLVFPALRGGTLSDMTLSKAMKRMHLNDIAKGGKGFSDPAIIDTKTNEPRHAVPHGLRSTFKDWSTELTYFDGDMTEIALAHKVGTEVERAYRRLDMLEKRRGQMQAWAEFLYGRQTAKDILVFQP
ncbi:DUF4102 domain-containing protein [Cohaesibacter sp. CAU 1516]|nr:DUF4102 domain-containing protein [Cohaesibacter sp. CAU 1516]